MLRVLRREIRHRRLRADDERELREERHDELAVWAQCLPEGIAPGAKLRLVPAQQRADEALEGLRQGGIRDVAFVLVVLPRREEAARRDERPVEFVHHRGLADAGSARDEHEFRRPARDDPVEGRQEPVYLPLPPVQLFREEQPVRDVVGAKRERVDPSVRLPGGETSPQIGRDARGGLIPVLSRLGEEVHDHGRDRTREIVPPLLGRHRRPGDVAMDPLHGIGGGEREGSREHLVERDAVGVQIAARIDRAVHPAGLFRRHVGERAGHDVRRRGRRALAWQAGRDAKAGQPRLARCGMREDMSRLDVLVDEAACVQPPECDRQADGHAQKRGDLPGRPQEARQELAAGICAHECRPPLVLDQRQGLGRPGGLQRVCQPLEAPRCGLVHCRGQHQERRPVTLRSAPGQDEFPILPQCLQRVSTQLHHGEASCCPVSTTLSRGPCTPERLGRPSLEHPR